MTTTGKWREFCWVFGSWDVVNSGTAGGTENGDGRNLKDFVGAKIEWSFKS